jgi:hypothetical protein
MGPNTSSEKGKANPEALLEQLRLLAINPSEFGFDDAQRNEGQRLAGHAARALRDPFEAMQSLVYSVRPPALLSDGWPMIG